MIGFGSDATVTSVFDDFIAKFKYILREDEIP